MLDKVRLKNMGLIKNISSLLLEACVDDFYLCQIIIYYSKKETT